MRTVKEIQTEIDRLNKAGREMNKLQNENAEGYDFYNHNKLDKLIEEIIEAKFKENWSLAQTIKNREIYNSEVRKLTSTAPVNVLNMEKHLGFSGHELKTAVEFYKKTGDLTK